MFITELLIYFFKWSVEILALYFEIIILIDRNIVGKLRGSDACCFQVLYALILVSVYASSSFVEY